MNLQLSQATGVPLWRQLRDQLADRIRAGVLGPGEALPSARQLAADCLVSMITAKRAYAELEAAGLVVSHQGRGTFVAEHASAASSADLYAGLALDLAAVVRRARAAGVGDTELDVLYARAKAARGGEED